jgi:hypothetical protein
VSKKAIAKIQSALDRKRLLEALKTKPVFLPVEGLGTVGFCALSMAERLELITANKEQAESDDPRQKQDLMLKILPSVLVDEEGNKLLTTADIDALNQGNAKLVQELVNVALDVNGMTTRAVEEIQKN